MRRLPILLLTAALVFAVPGVAGGLEPGKSGAYRMRLAGPREVVVYELPPGAPLQLRIAQAKGTLPGFSKLSNIAARRGAIAAINGDFGMASGRPGHLYVRDGRLIQTSLLGADGKGLFIGPNGASIGHAQVQISANAGGRSVTIDRWNEGQPRLGQIAAFTTDLAGLEEPAYGSCSVVLAPTDLSHFGSAGELERTYRVRDWGCRAIAPTGRDVTLAARAGTKTARSLLALKDESRITISTSVGVPWTQEVLGGSHLLVEDGRLAVERCSAYLCHRHSRTGVGVRADGTVLLVVVDGRQGDSIGMTLTQFGRLFLHLDATQALNLDGGGSSEMLLRGRVMNDPSDGVERRVVSGLLVVPRA